MHKQPGALATMFAPMTAQTEYARYEADMQERQRRAAFLANAQLPESYSVLHDVVRVFTDWALRRRAVPTQPANPALHEPATDCC
jgi:hypothetical protein